MCDCAITAFHKRPMAIDQFACVAQDELCQSRREREQERHVAAARLQAALADADARMQGYQGRKVAEMEQIHSKLQGVLDKKNATILQLRESLEAAHARLAAHEAEMRKQKLELFEQMKW
jgi:hypothetical protein